MNDRPCAVCKTRVVPNNNPQYKTCGRKVCRRDYKRAQARLAAKRHYDKYHKRPSRKED